jgi:hypothetical protein
VWQQPVIAKIRVGPEKYGSGSISLLGAGSDDIVGLAEAGPNVGLGQANYI